MRQVTVTEKYRAVNEGQMDKQEFVRQMRLAFPSLINQFNGYDDSVSILRTKGLLFEEKTMKHDVSDDSLRRALDIEIAALGHDPVTCDDGEVQAKAKAKAIANLSKDSLHYYNLLAKESSKVDKNDKMKETKRGALEKDTFNDMKKATLKEAKLMTEGTRALVGYLAGNRLTTAYNHYDGYPENLGKGLEAHYNDDDKAKDIAMKGYITYLNPETGEIEQTHKDAPKKITLPQDEEEFAREIAEEIDGMGADFGYIWDDRANRWVTIKNTGIRSMIDQIMEKLGDYDELAETEEEYLANKDAAIKKAMGKDVDEVDSTLDPYEDRKVIIQQVIDLLKTEKGADNEVIKDFIKTHYEDIINLRDDQAILDEFEEFLSVNTDYVDETDAYDNDEETQDMIDKMRKDGKDADDFVDEKKGKDHDKDGDIDGDDYMHAKDKAIKKAMGKKSNVNEAVKNIIQKVLEEEVINEAATQELARIANDYGDFEGLKPAVIALENVVTEIESFYDKTRAKIQKIYNDLGEIKNEEGLKVGAFITPSIENAFKKDLRPIIKNQFHGGLEMPKVKRISQTDVDRGYVQQEAPKQTVYTPVNEKKK
jgi:hypothetical protein